MTFLSINGFIVFLFPQLFHWKTVIDFNNWNGEIGLDLSLKIYYFELLKANLSLLDITYSS